MSNEPNPPSQRPPLVPGPPGTLRISAPAASIEQALKNRRDASMRPLPSDAPIYRIPGPVGNIAKAISSVMARVGTIKKGGYNAYYKYRYARMEDLLEVITPLMGEAGLAVIQNQIEIKTVETRLTVDYDFTLIHESGETLPPTRQTGMCIARNSKGEYDDKAIQKCHTQARKYYLLGLFNVPAGDFDDSDGDDDVKLDANQRPQQRPVPGPPPDTKAKPAASQEGMPHKIVLPQGSGADQWASAYIRNIGKAKSEDELRKWEELNDATLTTLSQQYHEIYQMLQTVVQRRIADLSPTGMPDPKLDAQDAMNWIAGQLQAIKTYEAAEAFWNQTVAPRETEFDPVDWGMLLGEWGRCEQRLAPPPDEPEAA